MTLKILTLIGFVIILPLFTRAMDPDSVIVPDPAVDPNPAVNPNRDKPVEIIGYNGVSVSCSIASFLYAFHDFKMIFGSMNDPLNLDE